MTEPRSMPLDEAAKRIPCEPLYLRRKAANRDWPARKIAGRWRFTEQDIDDILELTKSSPRPVSVPANGRSPHARVRRLA